MPSRSSWMASIHPLTSLTVLAEGSIESMTGHLHADFANRYIGGGVLTYGCVQEEIRFVVSPECLLSLHFSECMADNEAIVIRGTERYSEYSGYARHFQFAGSFVDETPCDEEGFRESYIVAYDALKFPLNNGSRKGGGCLEQFREQNLLRELRKVRCRHNCNCFNCVVFMAMEISIL
jgi:poly(ADP-ribose) glycohydrolase